MPSKNVVRFDADQQYYHVYARGANKSDIFSDSADKDYFTYLLARHLSKKPATNSFGYSYPHFRGLVELLAFCLMDNHFHLLVYQEKQGSLTQLMKSLTTSYTVYFNRKYNRTGPLFGGRFRSSAINKDDYLVRVSRYIHLNPRYWRRYPYSSLCHISNHTEPEWLQTDRLLEGYQTGADYIKFVSDYEDHKRSLDHLKHELADQ